MTGMHIHVRVCVSACLWVQEMCMVDRECLYVSVSCLLSLVSVSGTIAGTVSDRAISVSASVCNTV